MANYYCLVAGLPELALEDAKLSYSVADFKTEIYPELNKKDQKLVNLFYLKFDNRNLLSLLRNKEADTDARGVYSADELVHLIEAIKEDEPYDKKHFPPYFAQFIKDVLAAADKDLIWQENHMSALYYSYASHCKNKFIGSWFDFNLSVNNLLSALTARKYKWEVAPHIVGDSMVCEALRTSSARDFGLSGEFDYLDELIKITETSNLVDKEKKIDQLRWKWMEEATFFNYFSVERLFVFLLQIEMIERWISLDKETGKQMFRSIIDSLKNDVRIPEEFR